MGGMGELRRDYHDRLGDIQSAIGEMGSRVADSIGLVTEAVVCNELNKLRTIELSTYLSHVEYARIEAHLVDLLARQSPVASDLRFVLGSLRVGQEIRRSSDLVRHIASFAPDLVGSSVLSDEILGGLRSMAEHVTWMFNTAMGCYVVRNAELAAEVVERDMLVDRLYVETFDRLVQPGEIDKRALILASLTLRYMEQLGDHAEVIADRVRFVSEGEDPDELDVDLAQLPFDYSPGEPRT